MYTNQSKIQILGRRTLFHLIEIQHNHNNSKTTQTADD